MRQQELKLTGLAYYSRVFASHVAWQDFLTCSHTCPACDMHQSIKKKKKDALRMHLNVHPQRPGVFGFDSLHHKTMESQTDQRSPGLQRDKTQTDQAYSCGLELPSVHGKVLHMLEMYCLSCVSYVRDMTHLSSALSHYMVRGDTTLVC